MAPFSDHDNTGLSGSATSANTKSLEEVFLCSMLALSLFTGRFITQLKNKVHTSIVAVKLGSYVYPSSGIVMGQVAARKEQLIAHC